MKLYSLPVNIIEKQIIRQFHTERIAQSGGNRAQAQGWKSETTQQARFEVIISLADFNEAKVLDVGCGYGEFCTRLDKEFEKFEYIGLDQQPEFIAAAKQHFQNRENTSFHEVDFSICQLPKVDIVVASGIFAYHSSNPEYYFNMIKKFYEAANASFIFNMLDQDTFNSGSLIVAHNQGKIYQQCQSICENTVVKTGYYPDDFTISMSRVS